MKVYKCASCSIHFNKSSKASQTANRNKVGIKSSWLVHSIRSQGIDPTIYNWVCLKCHKSLSKSCPDKDTNSLFYDLSASEITEPVPSEENNNVTKETLQMPFSTSENVSLDFADIDDQRCKILTGISR